MFSWCAFWYRYAACLWHAKFWHLDVSDLASQIWGLAASRAFARVSVARLSWLASSGLVRQTLSVHLFPAVLVHCLAISGSRSALLDALKHSSTSKICLYELVVSGTKTKKSEYGLAPSCTSEEQYQLLIALCVMCTQFLHKKLRKRRKISSTGGGVDGKTR